VLAAGFLHDVVEDTDWTKEDIVDAFGLSVGAIVWSVTVERTPGLTKVERYINCYKKLRAVGPYAAMVKTADRLANVTASLRMFDGGGDDAKTKARGFLSWYVRDQPALSEAVTPLLRDSIRLKALWAGLLPLIECAKDPDAWLERRLKQKWSVQNVEGVTTSD
jgi:hypothetical protein